MAVATRPAAVSAGQDSERPSRPASHGRVVLVLVLGVAFVTRLLATRALWLDETTTIAQARLPFGDMIAQLQTWDVHPPLYHVVMWGWTRLFGSGELAVRMPSILAGVATVAVVYLLGRDLFSRRAGLLAATATAVAPVLVWYGQEARMYSLVLLLALVAVWAQSRIVNGAAGRHWVVYTAASVLLLWTHYFAVLYVAVQQLAFALVWWRRRHEPDGRSFLHRWAAALAGLSVLVAPLWFVLWPQLQAFRAREAMGDGHLEPAAIEFQGPLDAYAVGANFVWSLWGFHPLDVMVLLVALWPLLMLAGLVMLGRAGGPWNRYLGLLVLAPPVALFVLGQYNRFVFEVRYFLISVPLVLLLMSHHVDELRTRLGRVAAGTLLVLPMLLGLVHQQLSENNPRAYDFDDVVGEIVEQAGPDDVLVFEPWYLDETIAYYGDGIEAVPLQELERMPDSDEAPTVFVVGSFLEQERHASVHRSAVETLAAERTLVWQTETPNVEARAFR